jgi:hypothetical protein
MVLLFVVVLLVMAMAKGVGHTLFERHAIPKDQPSPSAFVPIEAPDAKKEMATVESMHPGWGATVNTDEFKSWLERQPPEVRARAQSEFAWDAIMLLDLYKREKPGAQ